MEKKRVESGPSASKESLWCQVHSSQDYSHAGGSKGWDTMSVALRRLNVYPFGQKRNNLPPHTQEVPEQQDRPLHSAYRTGPCVLQGQLGMALSLSCSSQLWSLGLPVADALRDNQ